MKKNPSLIRSSLLALVLGFGLAGTAQAALDVSMSVSGGYPNPIYPGDITSLHITLTNSNAASSVTGTAFTDTLTGGLTVAGSGLTAYTCTAGDGTTFTPTGTVTATVGGTAITMAGGTVPLAQASVASGKCDIDVEVTSTVVGVVTNTIGVGTVTGTDVGAVSNSTQGQQSITVLALNPPVITKGFSVGSIVKSDQTVRLTIVLSNANNLTKNLPLNTGADTPAFAVRDTLPAGLQVAATPNATSTCTGAGVAPGFAPAAADTVLTAVGGTVAAGGTCTVAVDLVGTDTGGTYSKIVSNTINRISDFGNERGLTPASNATASLTITSIVKVSKTFSPATVAAGQQATLTITITNASPLNAVTLTSFTDSPIDGAAGDRLTVGVPTTNCAGASVAATAGNAGITLTGGTIAANGNCTITIPYTGTLAVAGVPQSFTNTIPVGAVGTTDASIFSQSATHSVTVVDQLTVSKASTPTTMAPGSPIKYTLTVNNYSVSLLNNVRVTDALPAGMVAMPTSPAAPVLSGTGCTTLTTNIPALPTTTGTPQFTIGSVAAGSGPSPTTCTIVFWAMAPAGATGSATNTIAANGVRDGNGAGTVTNANASNGVGVTFASTATVSKSFSPNSAFEGTVSTLTVIFTNISAQALTGASFTDNLPVNGGGLHLIVANPASASSTCSGATITAVPGATSVTMTGATIPARAANGTGANGTCTLTVKVVGPAGVYTNSLPAGALSATDTYTDTTTHTVTSPGPVSAGLTYSSALTTGKSFAPTVVNSGGRSTVTLQLGNVGTGTLNNVSVTDPLPAGMVVATPSNTYTTCGGSPVITATPAASSASMTGAVIPASGACNFLFDVIATGGSNWTNTIPVGNVTANGGVQNISAVSTVLTNSSAGAVSVTNNTSPNSLTAPGQNSILTLTLTNSGTIPLTGLSLTDYFTNNGLSSGTQTGMQISSAPGASTTCTGGIVLASADGTSFSLSGASLAASASCTVNVNVTMITIGTVQNTVPVGAIGDNQGISNTTLTVTSLSTGANIGVSKVFTPAVIKPGDRSRLHITFINPIALPLTNLAATDNLPGGVTIPATPNPVTTCTGATLATPTASQITLSGGSQRRVVHLLCGDRRDGSACRHL